MRPQAGLIFGQDLHSGPILPIPRNDRIVSWKSIAYLHGRLDPSGVANDQLVLTSADFGRAYLTDGWAARFVTRLFSDFTVLFIGYSLNDPVLRYMTDAFAAEDSLSRFAPSTGSSRSSDERTPSLRNGRKLSAARRSPARRRALCPFCTLASSCRPHRMYEALQQEGARAEASDVIRSLVSEIVLTPTAGELLVDLRGDLAGILAVASSGMQKSPRSFEAGSVLASQVMLVAGTGFEPVTFRL